MRSASCAAGIQVSASPTLEDRWPREWNGLGPGKEGASAPSCQISYDRSDARRGTRLLPSGRGSVWPAVTVNIALGDDMTLSDLASIGSFVSGCAVLVSLMFLTVQIRQANKNQRAIVQQGRATRIADFLLHVAEPSLLPAWSAGLRGDPDIGPERHFQFMSIARARFISFEDSFLQRRSGLMGEGVFNGHMNAFRQVFNAPGLRAAWKLTRTSYDPDFARYVDGIAREPLGDSAPSLQQWLLAVDDEMGVG